MELTLSPLTERMKSVCENLYVNSCALDYTFEAIPLRGTNDVLDVIAIYRFASFEAAIIFNSRVGKVQNVLECRITLSDGEPSIDFSLYDLMFLLDPNDFDCYLFPYIDAPTRMEACLEVIFGAVMKYKEQLNGIGSDGKMTAWVTARKKKDIQDFFNCDVFSEERQQPDMVTAWRMRTYREWYISCFSSRWYCDYINGNYQRAVKSLSSRRIKSDYEKRIQHFMQTLAAGASYSALPATANTFLARNGIKSARSRSAFITAAIIGAAGAFIGYTAIGYVAYFAIYRNALFCTSLYSGGIPLAALLCAVPTGLAAAGVLWQKLLTKREKAAIENAGLTVSDAERRSHRGSVHTAVIIGLLIMTFAAKSGIAIYENGIVDNSSPFENSSFLYSDIKEIYYEKEAELYHLRFDGNRTLTCSQETAEKYILNHVDANIVEIDKIKTTES